MVTHDINASVSGLNSELKKINGRAFQWKIGFNPDCNKQAQEVIFIRELIPPLVFNNSNVSEGNSQKHLEVTLNFKLTLYLTK